MDGSETPTGLLVFLIVMGVFHFLIVMWMSHDSAPGTGFRGYTTGYRVRLWLAYIIGIGLVAGGIIGLVWWR